MLKGLIFLLISCYCSPIFAKQTTEIIPVSKNVNIEAESKFEMAKESLQYNLNETNEKIISVTEPIGHSIMSKDSLRWIVFWLLIGLVAVWVGVRAMRLQSDPDIKAILENPQHLFNVPLERLEDVIKLLSKIKILDRVLDDCRCDEKTLKQALLFTKKHPDTIFYFNILQQRIGRELNPDKTIHKENSIPFYELALHSDFPLPFTSISVYILPFSFRVEEVNKISDIILNELGHIHLIITTNKELQDVLNEYRFDRTANVIIPTLSELTKLLLSPTPLEVLTMICANQLHIAHISPYQTEAGVHREMDFFGRGSILRRIMTPPINNYIVCGGRQLGKSSILKSVERHYRKNNTIKCYYIILSGNIENAARDLVADFAYALGLDKHLSFEDLMYFLKQPREFTYVFLIDEVDTFICHDRLNDYRVIRHFLSLSQTGKCFFILAGFWELYTSTFLESLSPLKNFGEFIQVEGLEESASYELSTIPLKWLGIEYEDKEFAFQLINLVGRRANLVTSMCHEVLQIIPSNIYRIAEDDIVKASNSSVIEAKISMSWGRLVDNLDDALLDRMIIYMCVKSIERLNAKDIRKALANYTNYHYTYPQFERALKRLELAFVIKRHLSDQRYDFCVPLFVRFLKDMPLDELIELEMMEYHYRRKKEKARLERENVE